MVNDFVLLRAPVTQVRTPGHTTQLRRRYPFQNTPTAVIIDPDETEVGRIVGSNTREFYLGKLRAIMNKM